MCSKLISAMEKIRTGKGGELGAGQGVEFSFERMVGVDISETLLQAEAMSSAKVPSAKERVGKGESRKCEIRAVIGTRS